MLIFPPFNEPWIKIDDCNNPISTNSYLKKNEALIFLKPHSLRLKLNFILCEVS